MKKIYQGETLLIENEVLDVNGEPANLTQATIRVDLKLPDGEVAVLQHEVTENIISIALATDQTTQVGVYTYQFKVTIEDEVKKTLGVFKVNKAVSI